MVKCLAIQKRSGFGWRIYWRILKHLGFDLQMGWLKLKPMFRLVKVMPKYWLKYSHWETGMPKYFWKYWLKYSHWETGMPKYFWKYWLR